MTGSAHTWCRAFAPVVFAGIAACSPVDATLQEPTPGWHRMMEQPRVDAYEESAFFEDGAAMRAPPEGTTPYQPVRSKAPKVDRALLLRGRDRYEVFCGPCHGLDGYAQTPVGAKMTLRLPASFHTEKLRAYSLEDLRDVIRTGYGLMPSYGAQLDSRDRIAVAAWIQVLQLSQHVEVSALPERHQRKLEGMKP